MYIVKIELSKVQCEIVAHACREYADMRLAKPSAFISDMVSDMAKYSIIDASIMEQELHDVFYKVYTDYVPDENLRKNCDICYTLAEECETANDEPIKLCFTLEEAKLVMVACEDYLRRRLFQFSDFALDIAKTYRHRDEIEFQLPCAFRKYTDTYRKAGEKYYPIPENGLIAETVWLAIRYALAWHDNPIGNWRDVRFDKPYSRCQEEIPSIRVEVGRKDEQ